jgi:branched-subunit amino acid aminotransferase/4-amino-4-deoxychorismate lyase
MQKIKVPNGTYRLRIDLSDKRLDIKFSKITPIKSHSLVTYKATRPNPKHKLSDRTIEDQALKFANGKGAVDAILIDKNGNFTEGSISNFFIVINKTIITPKRNILLGIMRKQVLKNVNVKFRNIKLEDVKNAEEIFITNSIKGIVPISKIDNHDKLLFPGPITQTICEKLT